MASLLSPDQLEGVHLVNKEDGEQRKVPLPNEVKGHSPNSEQPSRKSVPSTQFLLPATGLPTHLNWHSEYGTFIELEEFP